MEEEKREIHLAWMYPDILNLHGDRGNIMAFQKVASSLKLQLNVHRIDRYNQEIDFNKMDILFFPPGELRVVGKIVEDLLRKENELRSYIENEKTIIAIGGSAAIFANRTKRTDGSQIEGLRVLDMICIERKTVIGDDICFPIGEGKDVCGSQIQMLDIDLKTVAPLERLIYGYGNDGGRYEGAKYKNVIFTNSLGPVFVKNPWWAEDILREVAIRKGYDIEENQIDFELEKASLKTTKKFLETKMIDKKKEYK